MNQGSGSPSPSPSLDDPSRIHEIRQLLRRKAGLRKYYEEVYAKYADCLTRCPPDGIALELGSGASFVQERIPEMVTSDTLSYEGVDRVVDATYMPFEDASLRAIVMQNVFHHIADARAFFAEASRCLKPGGRILILDQYPGWISAFYLKHLHHEPFDPRAREWKFESTGPLSGANGALAWIVFERDRERFEKLFPGLRIERYVPHSPLRYWLAGGLKNWSLLPGWAFGAATLLDRFLTLISGNQLASFVDIELRKIT